MAWSPCQAVCCYQPAEVPSNPPNNNRESGVDNQGRQEYDQKIQVEISPAQIPSRLLAGAMFLRVAF